MEKKRAPKNRTLTLEPAEIGLYSGRLLESIPPGLPVNEEPMPKPGFTLEEVRDRTILGRAEDVLELIPAGCADLVFADPPYNLDKKFNSLSFKTLSQKEYASYLESWIGKIKRVLKPSGSIYICGDWRSSDAIAEVLGNNFILRNRITWEREKGRGAQKNWKNNAEDIWFATVSDNYYFNVDPVKIKKRVLAPYRDGSGSPKDWEKTDIGNFRLTHPSNIWTDLTVPYWSMRENTEHPTQKPEKLLARIILASCPKGGLVLDPFLGSGTTSVTAKKLERSYIGIEIDRKYCCIAEKRLAGAAPGGDIQGYRDGVFWERNSGGV